MREEIGLLFFVGCKAFHVFTILWGKTQDLKLNIYFLCKYNEFTRAFMRVPAEKKRDSVETSKRMEGSAELSCDQSTRVTSDWPDSSSYGCPKKSRPIPFLASSHAHSPLASYVHPQPLYFGREGWRLTSSKLFSPSLMGTLRAFRYASLFPA